MDCLSHSLSTTPLFHISFVSPLFSSSFLPSGLCISSAYCHLFLGPPRLSEVRVTDYTAWILKYLYPRIFGGTSPRIPSPSHTISHGPRIPHSPRILQALEYSLVIEYPIALEYSIAIALEYPIALEYSIAS